MRWCSTKHVMLLYVALHHTNLLVVQVFSFIEGLFLVCILVNVIVSLFQSCCGQS